MAKNESKVSLFVPGRLCLFGEHTDWAAEYGLHRGFCLVVGTDQGISATAEKSESFVIDTLVPNKVGRTSGRRRQMNCTWQRETLSQAAKDRDEFFRYAAGVAYQMSSQPGVTGGLDLRIAAMDLPLRKGVSSSAAVCILVAQAFNQVYKLGLFPHELMEIAYLGEKMTGSQCGRMDQACIYGRTPVLLTFDKSADIKVEPVFPLKEIHMFFVDLAGRKNTVQILADLQKAYLKDRKLQEALGQENERIMRQAYVAIGTGNARLAGRLMTEAQQVFDRMVAPNSPEQLASPILHTVLGLDEIAQHIYGGKGVGSQGDGTAQFVAKSAEDREAAMAKIHEALADTQCFPLTLHRHSRGDDCKPSPSRQN